MVSSRSKSTSSSTERTTSRSPRRRLARGFSLIEMTVVMVIVGVLAAVAVPNLNDRIAMYKEDEALAGVQAAMTRFRNLSRTKVVCVEVKIELNSLSATPYKQCDPLDDALDVLVEPFNPRIIDLLDFTAPGLVGDPVFQKRGGLDLEGPLLLRVQSVRTGQIHTLEIYPATGLVRRRL